MFAGRYCSKSVTGEAHAAKEKIARSSRSLPSETVFGGAVWRVDVDVCATVVPETADVLKGTRAAVVLVGRVELHSYHFTATVEAIQAVIHRPAEIAHL